MDNDKKTNDISDDELIARSRSGDAAATDFLMEKYKGLVRQKAKSMFLLGGDTDDLIQEGMLGLFKAVRDYDPGRDASFYTFASLCISRQMYSAVQASGRKKHLPLNTSISLYAKTQSGTPDGGESDAPLSETLADSASSPEEQMVSRENTRRLEEMIDKRLSPLEKQVLELQVAGVGYVEIAKILGRDQKSIDNALQRVRAKIRKILEELKE